MTVDQVQNEAVETAEHEGRPLSQAMGKMILASIGAVGLAQDGIEHMLNRMVERGEVSRKQARRRMHEMRAKGSNLTKQGLANLDDNADLPSKADLDALHAQIAELTAKVEQLSKETAPATKK